MDLKKLQDARKAWEEETLKPTLERAKERVPEFTTPSGLPVKRLYTPEDAEGRDYLEAVGFPGQYPYTRGIYPTMYRGQFWTMRQYAGIGTARESNERFRHLLKEGQTGLSVAFDLPTQMGLDSDHPLAAGEVGQVGVAIDSLRDMEVLFDGIPLDRVTTSMTINAPASVLLALYVAVAEKQGVSLSKISGTVQNDVLKEYVARGTHIFPPRPSLRLAADLIAYCADQVPRWNPISISGYHMREAGASAVKEIAKYRALRRMWAKIMRERFNAKDPRSWMLRTHTQTGGSTLMAQQPENNIVRAAIQALAAMLGGVQSMALSCFDEALALPTEQAQRIALRTQQIIAYESGAADTVDPMAGSYYVEALTDELERRATEELEAIEATGGAVEAIERGYMQRAIQEEAYVHQQEVEAGTRVVVGVNRFQDEGKPQPLQLYRTDPEAENAQVRGLQALRRERDSRSVSAALARLRDAALGEENLLPPILQAVKAYATVGEICGVLREVFGEYKAPTGL